MPEGVLFCTPTETYNTMSATHSLFIGLMSGTSLDGVDGVLADFSNGAIQTLSAAFTPFPAELREELMALQAASHNELEREALAANGLALAYADCVRSLLPSCPAPVTAVAVHGQTIRHRPELGFTRQTNNPALLAELTGIDVIADFRSRDIAAGGQGAPLVPAFHEAAFGKPGTARVVVNIGGIGNISVLHGDGRVTGFDTGPGNVLLDLWIARHLGRAYDGNLAPADVQATLVQLTAVTIARAIRDEGVTPDAVYVCGGGGYNGALLRAIGAELGGVKVESTAALGVAPNRVEALAFAWLGWRFANREPGNLPAVTGARGPRILGALYPA